MVNKPELKIKEFDIYREYYCGLCHSLRKQYGLAGQLTLTYDMTFLAILLSSLYEPKSHRKECRCLVHPTKKHTFVTSEYTDYVADMNILLAYHKALDDWKDDHSVIQLAFSKMLKRKTDYKEKSDAIASLLNELGTREKENETNIDVMAGIFGKMISIVFSPHDDLWKKHLEKIGFFLGKFIYILDAYDDLLQDIKKQRYNPFKDQLGQDSFDGEIHSMLTMMMAECCREFEMLPITENVEILRNILYAGVFHTYYKIREERTTKTRH